MEAEWIERLRGPGVFPDAGGEEVEIVQTHLSVVCLAGDSAYKFKKGIALPFVDFSTLEQRKFFCEEEVRLNRRLCPEVYRGVAALKESMVDGRLTTAGDAAGEVIDYAVWMRRLPEERMMDRVLRDEEGGVSVADVEEIARVMAAFHAGAERGGEVMEAGRPEKLARFAIANFEETRGMAGPLPGAIFDEELHGRLEAQTRRDFEKLLPTMARRAEEGGRVVDGHGDLHARNICLTDPVSVYDCIEFNPELRCGDTATENAFLVMDLRYRRHAELASAYLAAYIAASGDEEQRGLMPALVRYRAMVRAKVAAIAAGEAELGEEGHRESVASARRHLHLAAASAIEEKGCRLVLSCGLPGSGKSFAFEALSRETGWPCFASDRVRKELAGVAPGEKLPERFYSDEFSERTYAELITRARATIESGRSRVVLLDANFRSRELRARVREVAAAVAVVWFDPGEEVIRERLGGRGDEGASDADLAVYEKLKGEFEAPGEGEAKVVVRVEAAGAPDEGAVPGVLRALMGAEVGSRA